MQPKIKIKVNNVRNHLQLKPVINTKVKTIKTYESIDGGEF